MRNPRARKILSVAALLLIALGIIALATAKKTSTVQPVSAGQVPARIAPPSAAVLKQLQESKGFSALVSYTDSGFQGATTTIRTGQSIRFTNNSSRTVWIGEITAANSPSDPNTETCDVPFNSCHALAPGDFVEFVFPEAGTFYYMDDLDTAMQGAVVVAQ